MSDNKLAVVIPISSSTGGYPFGDSSGNFPSSSTFAITNKNGQIVDITLAATPSAANGAIAADITKAASFSILNGTTTGNIYQITTGSSNRTVTLPTAATVGDGWYCYLRKADTGTGIILTSPTTTPSAIGLGTQGHMALVWTDGTSWYGRIWFGSSDVSGNITETALGTLTLSGTTVIAATGNLSISTIGKTLQVKSGSNASAGTTTLTAGASTVATTAYTANSVVVISLKTVGGTVAAQPYVATATPGTGFTLAGGGGSNTSVYNWALIEVN